ncbi:MlaA family lipoprotein [Pseudodonghicola flavimaris]|uniref:VacJ family lipoprotein n=1 Tax=Pseudodonghicola flavimaris TaxID=3050036 RepID=A0ABT7EWD6_9RHOB|nr:VacJ family lipoprotein [Pseudodonghicola flavimaris]MDK3016651.1 VacJ family lipoprotein [Pseudodonghicola flavimaris]
MDLSLRPLLVAALLGATGFLAGCATPTPEQKASREIFDPYESTNRSIHGFNVGLDKVLLRPAAKGYVAIVPPPMVDSFNYFAENLSMPGQMVDSLLQGKPKQAGIALARFVINSTVGFAGLSDPASNFEIPKVDTDFGETLHSWGLGEGAYIELPLYGPSTSRDAIGLLVDFVLNPLDYAKNQPVDNLGLYAQAVKRLGDRGRYSDAVDAILYESADSYAQARTIYMQNRRFKLEGDTPDLYITPDEISTEGF